MFKGASKKIVEKEYTDPEREAFILNSLLNAKWPPPEKTVFKFPEVVSVGFGWSRKSVLSSPHIYQRGGTPGRVYEIFYEPLEKELKEFLPQLEDVVGFDMRFVNASEEMAGNENNNVKIRIIYESGLTEWVNGKPVFSGWDGVLIEDDPRLRDDVVTFNTLSPFLRGYAYFDQEHNLTWAECQMWMYMEPSDRQEAMRECVVRALGVVGEIKGREHFQSSKLPDILKKTLVFLYCSEVKGGMRQEELLKILHEGKCLPQHKE